VYGLVLIDNGSPAHSFPQGAANKTATATLTTSAGATSGTVTVAFTVPSGLSQTGLGGPVGWTCAASSCSTGNAIQPGSMLSFVLTFTVGAGSGSPQAVGASVSGGLGITVNATPDSLTIGQVPAQTHSAVNGGGTQSTAVTLPFPVQLSVVIRDASGNPINNFPVIFTAPQTGASATFGNPSVYTNQLGIAAVTASANSIPGSYLVTATAGPVSLTFNLTNTVADLVISKTHVGHFSQGQTDANYSITASNVGTAPTNGSTVTVTDTLPAGLTATAMSGTGWNCVVALRVCSRADVLANGSSFPPIAVTVAVAASAPGSVVNTATVSGGGEINLSNDSASDTTLVNPIQDVSTRVSVTQSGLTRNRSTGLWAGTMTVQNMGPTGISGPIQVVLTNLTQGVTMTNGSGTRNESPYITVAPAGQALAAGASVNVSITFSNPNSVLINYTPVTNTGAY
jgi:uncharacterized repeat protein (TIGR01451 family)